MKLTPKAIVEQGKSFSIPIYQRLFEWDAENIERLLDDLKHAFDISKSLPVAEDYYIGMLTSTKENELVDGQQRFTVMMLIGCALKMYPQWHSFIVMGESKRLKFSARPADDDYLRSLIFPEFKRNYPTYTNSKMAVGKKTVEDFFSQLSEHEAAEFADYIYSNLSFFISELPERYLPTDLNKYFERMNCSGKNLEQHEILKVKLLSKLSDSRGDLSRYMQLWNNLADVDTPLIRGKMDENLKWRKREALSRPFHELLTGDILSGMSSSGKEEGKSIINIPPQSSSPKSNNRGTERENSCALRFSYILLHTLYWMCGKDGIEIEENIKTFFNPSNLIDLFRKYLPFEGEVDTDRIERFLDYLLRARFILDLCFVRPTDYGFELDMCADDSNKEKKSLLMLQSMLYVSSSNYTNYRWFNWLMEYIIPQKQFPDVNGLYAYLEKKDSEEHPMPERYSDLSFGNDVRYWFWRLDFYIWQNRDKIFANNEEALEVANKYVFIRNRSLEHIAPQTPMRNSAFQWVENDDDDNLRDSFGNLVMISQGLNSSLQNESFEMKREHVASYMHGSKTGSIESLKLLLAYHNLDKNVWTRETIRAHGKLSFNYLRASYGLPQDWTFPDEIQSKSSEQ